MHSLATAGRDWPNDPDTLRTLLSAEPVPDTNLLELRAEGDDPALLQQVVNLWADAYEAYRSEEIEAVAARTTAELEDEQARLQGRIATERARLQAFRENHDIVSLERTENRALAQLNGLNASLNKARERLVEARAGRDAVEQAVARGETVVPDEQKAALARQQLQVQAMRDRLAGLEQRYTRKYLEMDPALKQLPEELQQYERDLQRALALARETARQEAAQELDTAQRAVAELESELVQHQQQVQEFTENFKEFKALEEGLARLDKLYADNAERLAQIQIQNREKYPPVQVVDRAILPTRPIYPDYQRDLLIGLGLALLAALFLTWLFDYLAERTGPRPPYMGMRIYSQVGSQPQPAALNATPPAAGLQPPPSPTGLPALPRELLLPEVASLLQAADVTTAGYAAMLLSGVAPSEFALLHPGCFDAAGGTLSVPGAYPRDLGLGAGAVERVAALLESRAGATLAIPEPQLDAALAATAARAGIPDPGGIAAGVLRYTYLLFLVRQGAGLNDLYRQTGQVEADLRGALAAHAPPGADRPIDAVLRVFPGLG